MTPEPTPTPTPQPTRREILGYWWVLPVAGTLGAFVYMGNYARKVTFGKHKVGPPRFQPRAEQRVAPLAAFKGPYSSVDFTLGQTPCIALQLPQATPHSLGVGGRHFAAFSRVCTHLGCQVNAIDDLEVLALTYNYRTDHPMLGCPCHNNVFDPLLEGESVFGKALYPLPRVRLIERSGVLYAVGLEPDPNAKV